MAQNQYQITIKLDSGEGTSKHFAGTNMQDTPSVDTTTGKTKGTLKTFAKTVAALGLVSSAKSIEKYVVNRVATWTGNQALQDQITIGTTIVSEAVSFGFAAATGPLGLAAWGVGKITSFALQAGDFYYNRQMEEYARQLNYERQSEGRYFE